MRVGKLAIRIDLSDFTSRRIYFREYERDIIKHLRHVLKPGMICLDIGANIGYLSAVMADCVGASGRVFAFEPSPDTFERLRINAGLSRGIVEPLQLALSDSSIPIPFYASKEQHALSTSVVSLKPDQCEAISVQSTTVDEVCLRYNVRPALIKIDVEGAEPGVIKGMQETLAKYHPIILCEFKTWIYQSQARDVFWSILNYQYQAHAFTSSGLAPLDIEAACQSNDDVNVIFTPLNHKQLSRRIRGLALTNKTRSSPFVRFLRFLRLIP